MTVCKKHKEQTSITKHPNPCIFCLCCCYALTCRHVVTKLLLVREACVEHAHAEAQVIGILQLLAEQLVLAVPVAQLQALLALQATNNNRCGRQMQQWRQRCRVVLGQTRTCVSVTIALKLHDSWASKCSGAERCG
jgi:hypothetical protein